MYIVTKKRTAWFDIEWTSLNEAGESVTNTIRMKGELVDLDRFNKFIDVALIDRAGHGNVGIEQPEAFIQEIAHDWADIVDEDNQPFAFNADNLHVMIVSPGFLLGFTMSYIKAWNGQVKVREKNSVSSPAAGLAGEEPKPRRRRKSS